MNCERHDDALNDYVDGARAAERPADARLAAFEQHLSGCMRCQAYVADFANIRRSAAELDEMIPPPRLWAKIAASIDTEAQKPWWQRTFGDAFQAWRPIAAAASLAMLVGGAMWLSKPAPAAPPQTASATIAVEPAVAPAEQHYEDAIAGLQQLADAQKPSLDPKTLAVLQTNLAVVDRAISESRAALSSEPGSALAQESLLDALDTKVSLLQDTVALASEGVDAADGAGDAAQELNQ